MSITIEVSPPIEKALQTAAAQGVEMTELGRDLTERAYAADNTPLRRPCGLCAGQFCVPDDILDAYKGK